MHTDDRRTVSGCFLFADHGLTEAAEAILDRCPIRSYRKGELIYSRDCYERAVGVLLSGEAEVLKGRGVVLNTLSAGDSFGVAGLFTENDRYVSDIRAVRPCRVLLLSAPALEQLFAADNAAALGYIRFLSGRICFLNQKLDAFTSSSAEGRIVVWLLENMVDSRVVIPRGYSDLSRTLGIGRASLYRCLDGLEAQGALRRQEREIEILRPELLQSRIG